ncbi:hypothetical protein ACA910_000621 [Epithemia clementina (nom. ined.)]
MGMVFGRQTVAEPAFEVVYKFTPPTSSAISYEIRRYGQRFAAEVTYPNDGDNKDHKGDNSDSTPFSMLAKYIGVFGTPENEGQQAISMTAPVIKEGQGGGATSSGEPVKIAMTGPVIKTGQDKSSSNNTNKSGMTMAFILPAEYDSIDKIPKPVNPAVHIKEIAPAVGAVHRYSGTFSDDLCNEKAQALAQQLRSDGLEEITNEYALKHYQFWGFNPPFTLPMFRRNEIWIELSEAQVNQLVNGVDSKTAN